MRRYRIRPSREMRPMSIGMSIVYIIVSLAFVAIGVTMVIPGAGLFGLLWTGMSLCFAIFGIYSLVRLLKSKDGGIYGMDILEDVPGDAPGGRPSDTRQRLEELQTLYDQRLITREEYEEKRREILREL